MTRGSNQHFSCYIPRLLLLLSIFVMRAAMASSAKARNVLGGPLKLCCSGPKTTGYYRDGFCHTGPSDSGVHVVCAELTKEFLEFSKSRGNDLMTPHPPWFPGLAPGDKWCLCALRWREAYEAGVAPPVDLEATNAAVLRYVEMDWLKVRALDKKETAGGDSDAASNATAKVASNGSVSS